MVIINFVNIWDIMLIPLKNNIPLGFLDSFVSSEKFVSWIYYTYTGTKTAEIITFCMCAFSKIYLFVCKWHHKVYDGKLLVNGAQHYIESLNFL